MMGAHNRQGFTIIEVLLYLSITALLTMTLMIGWSVNINTQRYKDSVRTLQAFMQKQYGLVYNVQNGRPGNLRCNHSVVRSNARTGQPRGQSNCVIMGRYVYIEKGRSISVQAIVGSIPADDDSTTDLASILAADPARPTAALALADSTLDIPWQATIVGADGNSTSRSYAIAIIRSPLTGTVHTFVKPTSHANLPAVASLVSADNTASDTVLCVDAGAPLSGGRMGVRLQADASAQSSITIISDGDDVC
jgi:type II secretory pathway pseudopilin PulG